MDGFLAFAGECSARLNTFSRKNCRPPRRPAIVFFALITPCCFCLSPTTASPPAAKKMTGGPRYSWQGATSTTRPSVKLRQMACREQQSSCLDTLYNALVQSVEGTGLNISSGRINYKPKVGGRRLAMLGIISQTGRKLKL